MIYFPKIMIVANGISQVIEILKPHYNNGIRNDLILYLSGWLRKLGSIFRRCRRVHK